MPKDGEPILRYRTHIRVSPNPGSIDYAIYRCLRAEGLPIRLRRLTDDSSTILTDLPSTGVHVRNLFRRFPTYQRTALLQTALKGDLRGVAQLGDPTVIARRGLIALPGDESVYDRAFLTAALKQESRIGFPSLRTEEDFLRHIRPLAVKRYPFTLLSAVESLREVYADLRQKEASRKARQGRQILSSDG
ncbi:hypothetical protein A2631_03330 [Candidatus Daviesbacteria bacterium RIFCSPHIGHO2_01_FULL_44_29]|uniref:Uncharacterized protein n=1 Tax=Candidatus Daviesbacteria bacterium RIFCSPHIGHO2_02_FULL_43_12 TaxID=1797776 RepID=A0A1F5KKU2_9BACT|nr:MAG: hypothetical protein A2631_03330 [Candidatus Daviesbacteria bacterium RIFCSPHIGHO2_01_FULL_44_29]OGE40286.1 MAG: hypothetical protein A3E86_03750 [Candidatus Daviesbacteria bacterium RIFCSPHIGHO2_12_FULL_47_45]OGE41415.1 MAG: hypothetical protein A3D25_02725 [Candidatus Daviesbacteria bacterium RIFCSPHIGHO2_02_FULL_43_12]OGE69615.1 MAG: hypothetical protein A3B55_04470 [Candidatus Daviesbacteria bacterium RIFCSPLOWO2_01_FULL_43_15]